MKIFRLYFYIYFFFDILQKSYIFILIFDFDGNKIKEINDSKDKTLLIDTFYDKKNEKIYIITINEGYIKSYDYY